MVKVAEVAGVWLEPEGSAGREEIGRRHIGRGREGEGKVLEGCYGLVGRLYVDNILVCGVVWWGKVGGGGDT